MEYFDNPYFYGTLMFGLVFISLIKLYFMMAYCVFEVMHVKVEE